MKSKTYSMNMCEGALLPKIISFTLPLIASSLLQLMFNAADMIVAGRFVGANALAAVGATSSLINLLVNVFMGLSVGTNVIVARFFGSDQKKDVSETVHTSITLAIICGFILTGVGLVFADPLLTIMKTPPEVLPLSSLYIKIYFIGMPVSMLYNFGSAILRAIGDTKRPLIYLTIAGIINVIFNVMFIVVFGMGVDGVAYATILSQSISAFLILRCLIKSPECYQLRLRNLRLYSDKVVMILRLGLPAGFQGAIFSLSNVLIQSSVNYFGSGAMSGNTATSNIEGFVYVAMNAFHHTCLTFTSQNYGAKQYERIKKICLICLLSVTTVGLVLGFICNFFGPQLLSIYAAPADRDTVVTWGMVRMPIIMLTYFTCGTMDTMVGAIRGLGYSILPMIVSLLGACGFRILWIFTIFVADHTLPCLYLSYPISWTLTTTVHIICFIIVMRKVKKSFNVQNSSLRKSL